jgi:hypothetical protein
MSFIHKGIMGLWNKDLLFYEIWGSRLSYKKYKIAKDLFLLRGSSIALV